MATSSENSVLIIEDSRAKATAIRECLSDVVEIDNIVETDTILIAGQLLEGGNWSGIILDLAFHRSQQTGSILERPYLAGIEILQQMNELRVEFPVIIATQHASFLNTKYGDFHSVDALENMLSKAFPKNFRELIQVDLGSDEWRHNLISAVRRNFI